MGSVLASTICHYCGGRATTEDHVVPRRALPKPLSRLPYWFNAMNVVPSCKHCNNRKSHRRSTCACQQCRGAWGAAKANGWIREDYLEIVVVVSRKQWSGRPLQLV